MISSLVARRLLATRAVARFGAIRFSSDNITYSGGQATEGQGGYYGSGGARVITSSDVDSEGRQALLAYASDVQLISGVMDELDTLESQVREEGEEVSSKSIELKSHIKKLMTSSEVVEATQRLLHMDQPVWGLSAGEREMIILCRDKMNEC